MPDRGMEIVDLFVRDLDQVELPPRELWRPAPRKESLVMKTSRYVLTGVAVAAVLAIAVLIGLGLGDRNGPVAASPSPVAATSTSIPATTAPATPTPTPVATPSPAATAELGAITGRFGYGSDFIPPVTVYAISTTDPRVWFSVQFPGLGNPPRATAQPGTVPGTYTITGVAPGTYWVVAYRDDGLLPDPGYYSRNSMCQGTPSGGPCPDVSPVSVTVVAGQTASGIDVRTWGTQPPPSPTLPPRPTPAVVAGPTAYQPPSECSFVGVPEVRSTNATYWLLKCPTGLLSVALAPSLTAQGWENCGAAAGTTYWRKADLLILITNFVNRADATGELGQKQGTGACGP